MSHPVLSNDKSCTHQQKMAVAAQHVPEGRGHAFIVCVDCGQEARSWSP